MDDEAEIGIADDEGASVAFPFDRMTVQRFRQEFPRARWSDRRKAWVVPGRTARCRINRWLLKEETRIAPHAEARGRDAFAFEPILSPYLTVDDTGFRVRTPYSRTVVEALRQVPFARWDGDHKLWRVPFASYEALQDHWQVIEEAARRNEPQERRKRAEARKGTDEERKARLRATERRRRRIPLPADDLPPLARPIATRVYGIVLITGITGEIVDPDAVAEFFPGIGDDAIWGTWRPPTLEELVRTWPARTEPKDEERRRGWWLPTIEELREARRTARSRERRRASGLTSDDSVH